MNGAGFIHAGAVVVGETGILIEGAAGSGKSSLAAALLAGAACHGLFARLVADDRVGLRVAGGRLLARPHPSIAGLIERRGWGLLRLEDEPACVLGLAVALAVAEAPEAERLPAAPPQRVLHGIALPLLALRATAGSAENSGRILAALTLPQRVVAEQV